MWLAPTGGWAGTVRVVACAMAMAGAAPSMAADDGDRAAVTRALQDSAAGWSRSDLAGFMAVYENAPSTTYLNGTTIVRGFASIRALYSARFAASSGNMGRLTLDVMEFRPLGPDHALCIGRFRLARRAPAPQATGMFTLVFHRTPDGWKIVSDHTSA